MSNIQRYQPSLEWIDNDAFPHVTEDPEGDYVLHADHAAELARAELERDAAKAALAFIGGAVQTTRAHVWTETPGVEVQAFPDAGVPHSLRLVVRDVHAKEDLASVRVEAFRLDLLCGPIVRLGIEYQARIARAAVEKGVKES